jgi:hypothetical protein
MRRGDVHAVGGGNRHRRGQRRDVTRARISFGEGARTGPTDEISIDIFV